VWNRSGGDSDGSWDIFRKIELGFNPGGEIIGLDQEQGVTENKKGLHRAGNRA
jgi:hypothetical protein